MSKHIKYCRSIMFGDCKRTIYLCYNVKNISYISLLQIYVNIFTVNSKYNQRATDWDCCPDQQPESSQQTETVALVNRLNPVNRLRLLSQSTAWIHSSDWDCCRSQQTESIQQTETVASVNKLWLMPRSTDWIQLTEWDCCPSQQTETTVHVNSLLTTGLSDHSIAWAVTLMFSQ